MYLAVFEVYFRDILEFLGIFLYLSVFGTYLRVFGTLSQIQSNTLKYITNTFRYAIDTRITAGSDLGPGMVNVFGVEYGFNSVR